MNKRTIYILMILFLALAIALCLLTWQASLQTGPGAAGVTATYGAEQFHAQLTAMSAGAAGQQ